MDSVFNRNREQGYILKYLFIFIFYLYLFFVYIYFLFIFFFYYKISREKFEPEQGFEPRTSGFLARHSTT